MVENYKKEKQKVRDIRFEFEQEIQRGESKDQTISKLESCISELNQVMMAKQETIESRDEEVVRLRTQLKAAQNEAQSNAKNMDDEALQNLNQQIKELIEENDALKTQRKSL